MDFNHVEYELESFYGSGGEGLGLHGLDKIVFGGETG